MIYASTEATTYQFKGVEDLEDRAGLIVYGEVTKDFEENRQYRKLKDEVTDKYAKKLE